MNLQPAVLETAALPVELHPSGAGWRPDVGTGDLPGDRFAGTGDSLVNPAFKG